VTFLFAACGLAQINHREGAKGAKKKYGSRNWVESKGVVCQRGLRNSQYLALEFLRGLRAFALILNYLG